MYENQNRDWDRVWQIARPELNRDEALYNRLVNRGLQRALEYLSERARQRPIPTLDTLRTAHEYGFTAVYDFGGNIRKDRENVPAFGQQDMDGALPDKIIPELQKLERETNDLLSSAKSEQEKAQAIAFYHAKFEAIHPFKDGNGRTGRRIAQSQVRALLNKEPHPIVDRDTYLEAIREVHRTGNIAPLTYALTGVELSKELSQTPNPVNIWPITVDVPLKNGLSIPIECPNEDTDHQLDRVEVTSDVERFVEVFGPKELELDFHEETTKRPAILDLTQELKKKLRDYEKSLQHERHIDIER